MELTERIAALENRNKRVEADKKWETSLERRGAITVLTYLVVSAFLIAIGVNRPWINAIVPCLGFLLSTLTVSFLKSRWLAKRHLVD